MKTPAPLQHLLTLPFFIFIFLPVEAIWTRNIYKRKLLIKKDECLVQIQELTWEDNLSFMAQPKLHETLSSFMIEVLHYFHFFLPMILYKILLPEGFYEANK